MTSENNEPERENLNDGPMHGRLTTHRRIRRLAWAAVGVLAVVLLLTAAILHVVEGTKPSTRCPSSGLAIGLGRVPLGDTWPTQGDYDGITFGKDSGRFYVRVSSGGMDFRPITPTLWVPINGVFAVDFRIAPGSPDSSAAVLVLSGEDPTYLYLYGDRTFRLMGDEDSSETRVVIEGNIPASPQPDGWDRIEIVASGADPTTVRLNGQEVASWVETIRLGNIGFLRWGPPLGTIFLGATALPGEGSASVEYSNPQLMEVCDWDPRYGFDAALRKGINDSALAAIVIAALAYIGFAYLRWRRTKKASSGVIPRSRLLGLPRQLVMPALVLAGLGVGFGDWISLGLVLLELGVLWVVLRPDMDRATIRRVIVGLALTAPPAVYLASLQRVTSNLVMTHTYVMLLVSAGLGVVLLMRAIDGARTARLHSLVTISGALADGTPAITGAPILAPAFTVLWLLALPLWLNASTPGGPASWYADQTLYLSGLASFRWAAITALECWALAMLVGPVPGVPGWLRALGAGPFAFLGLSLACIGWTGYDLPVVLWVHSIWVGLLVVVSVTGWVMRMRQERRRIKNATVAAAEKDPRSDRVVATFFAVQVALAVASMLFLYLTYQINSAGYYIP